MTRAEEIFVSTSRALATRNLRVVWDCSWWERLVERWEYLAASGEWVRFWRRNGRVPDAAIPRVRGRSS